MSIRGLSFKRVALVASLAVAGLFGIASLASNNLFEKNNNIQKAFATDDPGATDPGDVSWIKEEVNGRWYRVLYFHVHSSWEAGNEFGSGNKKWGYIYHSPYWNEVQGEDYYIKYGTEDLYSGTICSFHEILGDFTVKIYLAPDVTEITFCSYNASGAKYQTDPQPLVGNSSYLSREAYWITEDNYNDGESSNGEWLEASEFLGRFYTTYFTVSCNWNGGNVNLTSDFVRCGYTTGYREWGYFDPNGLFGSDPVRGTPITKNMLRTFEAGKYYAEFLVPKDCDKVFLADDYDENGSNSHTGTRYPTSGTPLADKWIYNLTTNSGNPRTATYTTFPPTGSTPGYYLVGSGSFKSTGTDWEVSSGVRMQYSLGYKGVLLHQYLETGDVFKIVNSDKSEEYGWSYTQINSQDAGVYDNGINFERTAYKDKAGTIYDIYVRDNVGAGYSFPSGGTCYAYIYNSASDELAPWQGVAMSKKVDYYCKYTTAGGKNWNYVIFSDNARQTEDLTIPDLSSCDTYRITGAPWGSNKFTGTWEWSQKSNNIRVKNNGYYDIYLTDDGKIQIAPSHEEIYLDCNKWNWDELGATVAAHFWNSADGNYGINVKMTKVHGHNFVHYYDDHEYSNNMWELTVPVLFNGAPNMVIFYRTNNFDKYNMNVISDNKTPDLAIYADRNVYSLYQDNYTYGYWNVHLIDQTERANFYGKYVMTEATCSGQGSVTATQENWDNIKVEYFNMYSEAQTLVKEAVANIDTEAPLVEQGMMRYDVILAKPGCTFEDFIGRNIHAPANNRIGIMSFGLYDDSSISIVIIIIASSVSLLSITALSMLLVKKRKKEHIN